MMGMLNRRPCLALPTLMLWGAALGAQSLVVSPLELEFQAEVGKLSPPSQPIQVQTTPPGQAFSARVNRSSIVNPAWLFDPLPTNGQTPATLTVAVDTTNFDRPGVSVADIIVEAGGEQAVVKVTVTVTGASSGPRIDAAPNRLTFNVQSPGATAAPQNIIVRNSGGGFLDYRLDFSYASGPQGWLALTPPTSGRVGSGANRHEVRVTNTEVLQQGSYTARITVSGGSGIPPFTIPVTLTVGAAPALTATPPSLSFFIALGGAAEARTLTIRNTSSTNVSYTIASDRPWLTVNPAAANTAAGPVAHQVRADIAGLQEGNYLANLELTGAGLTAPFVIPVQLTVAPPSTLFVLPSRIDFVGYSDIPTREHRSIGVVSTPLGPGGWTATVSPADATWLKVSPKQGRVPGRVEVELDTTGLGASTLEAQIEIRPGIAAESLSDEGASPNQDAVARVDVRATILSGAPALDAAPKALLFRATQGQQSELQQALLVENLGGPQLLWQSEVAVEDGAWLNLSPGSGEAPARTRVTAGTSGLAPGVHHGRIRLFAGDRSVNVPVALVVETSGASLDTDVSSLYWEMTEGGAPPAGSEVKVLNRGAGTMAWTAAVVDFSGTQQWFGIGPASGASRADGLAGPAELTVTPIGTGLGVGVHSGLIEVRAEGQNPRLVTANLRVVPAAESVQRRVDPGGVVFVADELSDVKTATVRRNRGGAAPFVAGASTLSGGAWLSVTPPNGTATQDGEAELEIAASPAGLTAGIYEGQVGVTFGDGLVETVGVTLIAPPSGACTASSLAVVAMSPPQGFRAFAGRGEQITVELRDDCGEPVSQASVLATFNTGDAAVPLRRVGGGRYAATWGPANASSQANVVLTALAGTLTQRRFIVGSVEGSSHPAISRFGIVNAGSFASGEAISPGAIVSAFGRNFKPQVEEATALPLPVELNGLRLRMGGNLSPLYFKNNTQINAQAPFELIPGSTAQAVVEVDGIFGVPEPAAVASARPSVFPSADRPGRAIAQNQSGAINGPGQPALRGQAIVVYLSGIGDVAPAVATGAGAPAAEPLARAKAQFSATVGGKPAEIFFLGLTPGFVGLAQANLIVPADAPTGPDVPLSISVDGQPSNPLVISIGTAQP